MSEKATLNRLDKLIEWVAPVWAAKRIAARDFNASYRGTAPTRSSGSWSESQSMTGIRVPTKVQQRGARNRSRSLDRNNVLASSILDRAIENIIGTGIQVQPTTGVKDFDRQALDAWSRFKDSCDVTKRFHYDYMQRLMLRSCFRDGDVGAIMVDNNGQPQKQLIEGDYLESPPSKYIGGIAVDGVELDASGAPLKFWIRTVDQDWKTTFTSIPERDFQFLACLDRFQEYRGMPLFTQAFDWFDNIEGYAEGTVITARAGTLFSLLIKKNGSNGAVSKLPSMTNSAGNSQRYKSIEGGTIKYLEPDEDVVQVDPKHPTQSFPESIASFCRFVGLKFGLPIEEVLLDYSRANYTVSRAIKMKIQRVAEIHQQNFASNIVSRDYRWVISKAIKTGLITARPPQNYWQHDIIPDPIPLVDPLKDLQASQLGIEMCVNSRTSVARENGKDFLKIIEQNKLDRESMNAAGVPINDSTTPQQAQQQQQTQQDTGTQNNG